MSQYYLHDGKNQLGPFTLEELKQKEIKKETPIWKDGMQDWTKAGELSELATYFQSSPPVYKPTPPPLVRQEIQEHTPKKNGTKFQLLLLLVVLGVGGYMFWKSKNDSSDRSSEYNSIDYNSGSEGNRNEEKSPEELKEDLSKKEHENPAQYLVIKNATFRKNLVGEIVLEGSIKNTATVAAFKDIVVEASFRTPSGTILEQKEFTRYEKLGPGYDVTYKFKANVSKEVDAVSVSVINAKALY